MPKRNFLQSADTNYTEESSDDASYVSDESEDSSTSGDQASLVSDNHMDSDDGKFEITEGLNKNLKVEILHDNAFLLTLSKRLRHQMDLNPDRFENSVVDITNNFVCNDYENSWLAASTGTCGGSGFILKYNGETLLMTNAHVAEQSSSLSVRLADESKKYPATLRHLDHDCDLAVLDVNDQEFWDKVVPLELSANMPGMRSMVAVVGFPKGGNEVCITEGAVSRIEVDTYVNGATQLLQAQVSAPINPGNSGGPVINVQGECVGVAFQGDDGDGLGFIIPSLIVRRYLDDLLDTSKPYMGFPELAFSIQPLQNLSLKKYFGVSDDIGIAIGDIHELSGLKGILKRKDVLLALDGIPVHDDGTVETGFTKRLHFDYLVTQKHIGDTITAKILRHGQIFDIDLPLLYRAETTLIRGNYSTDLPPTYLIVCGIVLEPLSEMLVDVKGNDLLSAASTRPKKFIGEEIVVISKVFATDYTINMDKYACPMRQVTHINGTKIKNLRHAMKILDENVAAQHILKTADKLSIALENITDSEHLGILKQHYRIDRDRSEDLLKPQKFRPGCPEYGYTSEELEAKADEQLAKHKRKKVKLTL